jgi:hypothetical protein
VEDPLPRKKITTTPETPMARQARVELASGLLVSPSGRRLRRRVSDANRLRVELKLDDAEQQIREARADLLELAARPARPSGRYSRKG